MALAKCVQLAESRTIIASATEMKAMSTTMMKPRPYTPRPWQLTHMLATPVGGTVLIVERCEEQPDDEIRRHDDGRFYTLEDGDLAIPLGPVGTVLACKEALRGDGFPGTQKRKGIARYAIDGEMVLVNGQDHLWYAKRPTITAKRMPLDWARLFFRTTAIDLRQTDSMTGDDANAAGVRHCNGQLALDVFVTMWLIDNPGATWGDCAWFITAERVERA
ncbi:MAG: hypothetical protein KGL35_24420 [Bradyrhizobium sp.]|nr:hypothetical protein [Bradyrhizobium sp.]